MWKVIVYAIGVAIIIVSDGIWAELFGAGILIVMSMFASSKKQIRRIK